MVSQNTGIKNTMGPKASATKFDPHPVPFLSCPTTEILAGLE